jgi:hypothetical protein
MALTSPPLKQLIGAKEMKNFIGFGSSKIASES